MAELVDLAGMKHLNNQLLMRSLLSWFRLKSQLLKVDNEKWKEEFVLLKELQ